MQNRGHGLFFAKRRVGKSEQVPEAKKAKKNLGQKKENGRNHKREPFSTFLLPPDVGKRRLYANSIFLSISPSPDGGDGKVWCGPEGGGREGSFVVWGLGLGQDGGPQFRGYATEGGKNPFSFFPRNGRIISSFISKICQLK